MWEKRKFDLEIESKILSKYNDKLIARLLSQRSIKPDDVSSFIECKYEDLSDPYSFNGMEKAVKILAQTAHDHKQVAVIGDYDCDGIFSSAMIKEACRSLGIKCKVFLPSRMEHGYGLNDKTIEAFSEKINFPDIGTLIMVDCGTNNKEEIEWLRSDGIKNIIVIDHHLPDMQKISDNADVIINWHLDTNKSEMCAAGEVFQFIRGIRKKTKKIDPMEFITYAAIGTIADVSPIVGDNRIIVRHGLKRGAIGKIISTGLNSLKRQSKIYDDDLTQEDVSFKIAPRINAVGRIENPLPAYGLLIEKDNDEADLISEYVDESNKQRKMIQKEIEYAVEEAIKSGIYSNGILVYNKNWHIGIVGIVASRISETFNKPTFILGEHNGVIKGSGRSGEGINLKEIMDSCSYMFEKYGGHAHAAGATLKRDFLEKAPLIFDEACKKYYELHLDGNPKSFKKYDVDIPPQYVNTKIAQKILSTLYPYCTINNPEPIFRLHKARIHDVDLNEGEHWKSLKFYVSCGEIDIPMKFLSFSSQYGTELDGMVKDIYFSFPQRIYNKNGEINPLNIIDILDIET